VHYYALHYSTLHYITLHYIISQHIARRNVVTKWYFERKMAPHSGTVFPVALSLILIARKESRKRLNFSHKETFYSESLISSEWVQRHFYSCKEDAVLPYLIGQTASIRTLRIPLLRAITQRPSIKTSLSLQNNWCFHSDSYECCHILRYSDVYSYINQSFAGMYHIFIKGWKSAEQETCVQQLVLIS
jgi:hypothetical protein